MALTAASPAFRGLLVDTDCRWSVIEASVDDRNREERGLDPLLNYSYKIPKSRYASVSRFISNGPDMFPEYNDLDAPINQDAYNSLIESGVDDIIAKHVAHLFIRDPLVIFREFLQQDNSGPSDHFENIQSTNWQTCRFKPPSLESDLGWRVEFRPMEVQLDDTANAAFAIYPILLIRAIIHFNLSLLIPLSLVDSNMSRAQKRDSVLNELFYFRTNSETPGKACSISLKPLKEIIHQFNQYIFAYLKDMSVEAEVYSKLSKYISHVTDRANGTIPTPARLIRDFILNHSKYNQDSIVNDEIIYDLMKQLSNK